MLFKRLCNIFFSPFYFTNNKRKTHLNTRTVGEKGFRALRMVQGTVANAAPWSPNGEVPAVKQVPRTVAVLSSFIYNLQTQ